VSNRGGLIELVTHNKTGIIVEPENINLIADEVIRLVDDPALVEKMGLNAEKRIIEKHTYEHEAKNYESIYQELIK
jgi:glycosyltransferase involved in cell wall biosynthesis